MRVRARAIATIAAAVSMAPLSLHAQADPAASRTPKVEVAVDYSHFGVGVGNTEGTNGNRMVGLNGGSASVALNFNRFFGIVADFGGYDANKLELVGNGANQPRVISANGTAYTYLFGPRISYRTRSRFTPFLQVLVGGVHASPDTVVDCSGSACTPLPAQNAFSMTAGGGLDIRLTRLFSLRAVQAEYMMTRFAEVPSGTSASQDDLRLSAGIVVRFAAKTERAPLEVTCSVQPQSGFVGDPFVASASAVNLGLKHPALYAWTVTGGTVNGSESSATIQTAGLAPGSYTVSANVRQGSHAAQQATCSTTFTIQAPEPPTVSCSANPDAVTTGASVKIEGHGISPQNRTLTYSYLTSAGHIAGNAASALLTTDGVEPGLITVTCGVVDDLGKTASATVGVNVAAPAPTAAEAPAAIPQTINLCSISFERDRRRPTRVDNEAKACLDDIALQMQRESAGHLVIVGGFSSDEKPQSAQARAQHELEYLTDEKGIDPRRIELRAGPSGHRSAINVFVPAGAAYDAGDSTPVAPNK